MSAVEALNSSAEMSANASEGAGFPPFDSTTYASAIFWLVVTFGILYFVISRIALPRMQSILAERRNKIDSDLEIARHAKVQADAAAAAHEKMLAEARSNAQAMAAATREQVAQETKAKQNALEAELNEKLSAAEAQIAATKTKGMDNVAQIAQDTAGEIVRHLTGQTPDAGAVSSAVAAQGALKA